jgi:hypothetical protein
MKLLFVCVLILPKKEINALANSSSNKPQLTVRLALIHTGFYSFYNIFLSLCIITVAVQPAVFNNVVATEVCPDYM